MQEGIQDLRPAQSNRGTGERSDQGSAGPAAVCVVGLEKVDAEWHMIAATHNLL